MRVLNGSLTEPRLLWHFNRKRGEEELRVEGGHQLSRGHCAELFCVPLLPPCPLRPLLRAVGLDSHCCPSPNLPTRQGIHRIEC